jgi:hypothetical protein
VWTWHGLVTYYTVFIIDLASRRVQILGSTPHPETLFMQQIVRTLTMAAPDGVNLPQVLICDRDRKWSHAVQLSSETRASAWCSSRNAHQTRTPTPSDSSGRSRKNVSNASFHSVNGTSGTQSWTSSSTHRERNHQGLDNRLIAGTLVNDRTGRVRCRRRLGGLLNFYERAA